jgi:hypothetical protein
MVGVQAGVQYTLPVERVWLRFSAGYGLEAWWFRATGAGANDRALYRDIDILDHGPFGRCEVSF